MTIAPRLAVTVSLAACLAACGGNSGPTKAEFDAKSKEADDAKAQVAALKQQLTQEDQQITDLKNSLGMSQSKEITDDQKSALEDAKRAVQEAQDRTKLLDDLQGKFKKLIDLGHLKVTTRHGRVVLQLHNDVLFDKGEADLKPDGKTAVTEVAATLRSVGGKRFQVAGHTDSEPITAATKKLFPTNWELSSARAISVVKLLTTQGVDPNNLSAAGYGPYDPVASNGTPDGQAKNRRIEITLVPNVANIVQAAKTPPAASSAP
jgi:chemotaxis protein MotB